MDAEQLLRALDDLEQQGVLSPEQRARVHDRLVSELPKRGDRMGLFVRIVAMFGALLLGAGVLLFFAANWDAMGKGVKLVLIFGLFLGVHHVGFALAEEPGRSPGVGRALTALGVLLFGGAIGLVAQIYHLSSDYPWAMLSWWTLSVPFVLLTRSRAVTTAVLGLFLFWLAWHAGWRLDRVEGRHDDESWVLMFAILGMSTGALLRGVSLLLRRAGLASCEQPLRLAATPCVLVALYALSFGDVFPRDFDAFDLAPLETPLVVAGVAIVLLVAAVGRRSDREEALVGFGSLVAAGVSVLCAQALPEMMHVIVNVVLFTALLVLVAVGVRRNAPSAINYGIVGFLGLVVTRYVEYVGSEIDPFVAFILGGAVLLGLGWWLESKRRDWIADAARNVS